MCRSPSKTATLIRRPHRRLFGRVCEETGTRDRGRTAQAPAHGKRGRAPCQHRQDRRHGRSRARARREPHRDRARTVLRLGAQEPRRADAVPRASRTGDGRGGGVTHASPRPHRHRRRGSGLLRPLSKAVRRRLGPAFAQRDAGGQGAALSRRRVDHRPCILERARAFARRYLGKLPGLQCLPRHRMDEGAMRKLPASRAGFRRLPLPGLRAHR